MKAVQLVVWGMLALVTQVVIALVFAVEAFVRVIKALWGLALMVVLIALVGTAPVSLAVLVVIGLFAGNMPPGTLWKKFNGLCRTIGIQIASSFTFQKAMEPDDPNERRYFPYDGVYAEIIAGKEDFLRLRQEANDIGLWFVYHRDDDGHWFKPLGRMSQFFLYKFDVINKQTADEFYAKRAADKADWERRMNENENE